MSEENDETRREGPERSRAAKLARGATVGRYMILDVLGEGGMGVVYSAFDPELDRKVAIKLLQSRPGSVGQAWIQREAQAMARLSHPNVLAVHDVGTVDDQMFITMELVDGETLREWLEAPRPWREVVQRFRAAGEGLAAAHRAGLVHRDFKPDNVLVGPGDRVRVLDFGLARQNAERLPDPDEPPVRDTPLTERLTRAGAVVGTPAYMAPEVAYGGDADARSDQFSFAVALYAGLYRQRPFAQRAKGEPAHPPPVVRGLPRSIGDVVMRALAVEPDDRYPTMDELLVELTRAAAPPRRTRWVVAAVGATALAVGGLAIASSRETPATIAAVVDDRCATRDPRLAAVWDDARYRAVREAFLRTEQPFAERMAANVDREIAKWRDTWAGVAREACERTLVRHEQAETVHAIQQLCLEDRLLDLRAAVDVMIEDPDNQAQRADRAILRLPSPKRCGNVATLSPGGLPPRNHAKAIDEARGFIAKARGELMFELVIPAAESSRRALELLEPTRYEPYRAEALLLRGSALAGMTNLDVALVAARDAATAALAANRDDLLADATSLTSAIGSAKDADGTAALVLDKLDVAGDESTRWASLEEMGIDLLRRQDWLKARSYLERALAAREAAVGSMHPDIASLLANLGASYAGTGDHAKAREHYERAREIRKRVAPAQAPQTMNNLADSLIRAGDFEGALEYANQSRLWARAFDDSQSWLYHASSTTYAEALIALRRYGDAKTVLDEVIPLAEKNRSRVLGDVLVIRALLAVETRRWSEVASFAERAIKTIETSRGVHSPTLFRPLVMRGRAELELGHKGPARTHLEQAISIGEATRMADRELADVRALLARAR